MLSTCAHTGIAGKTTSSLPGESLNFHYLSLPFLDLAFTAFPLPLFAPESRCTQRYGMQHYGPQPCRLRLSVGSEEVERERIGSALSELEQQTGQPIRGFYCRSAPSVRFVPRPFNTLGSGRAMKGSENGLM